MSTDAAPRRPALLRVSAVMGFIVLGLAALFNLAALSIAESSYVELRRIATAVVQTQRVTTAIEDLRSDLDDAEASHRGYVATGDEAFLVPYQRVRTQVDAELEALHDLVAGNAVQLAQIGIVRPLVRQKMQELEALIRLRREQGFEAARERLATRVGKVTADTIEAALLGMLQEETRVRAARIEALQDYQRAIRLGFFGEASLNLLLVTVGAVFLWNELRRRRNEQAELAARGESLELQVRQRTAQLTELSRFLETIREDEKQRVARELHDELGGTLTAAKIDLQLVSNAMRHDPTLAPRMNRINTALDDAIAVKRRIIEDLRPTLLDNLGVQAALRWQCDEFEKRTGCTCTLEADDRDGQPPPGHSIALYRIVQEALTNVAKYAHARTVHVELVREPEAWHLRVADDGVGIDPAKQHHPTSHGLISIRERVHALGGEVTIGRGATRGTSIDVTLPVTAQGGGEAHASGESTPAPARRQVV